LAPLFFEFILPDFRLNEKQYIPPSSPADLCLPIPGIVLV